MHMTVVVTFVYTFHLLNIITIMGQRKSFIYYLCPIIVDTVAYTFHLLNVTTIMRQE